MAPNHHHPSPSLFILLITAALTLSDPSSATPSASPPTSSPQPPPPSPSPSPPPPPPSPSPPPPQTQSPPPATGSTPQQMNNIVDALIGSGDFGSWANIIAAANPLNLPLSATVFMPESGAVSRTPVADAFLLPYHVVPQRLTFADLRLFKTNSRLPTLLPGKSIVATCNSDSNFTVDGATITQPDVYVTNNVVVHGVARVLDYSVYGVATVDSKPKPERQPSPRQSSPPATPLWKSGAALPRLCVQFPVAFAVLGLNNRIR
ncbi:FAS1 domain-containing protein SELMODRAFT_448915-like [Argentina anserina]|uniref:FAS1 domain-containing protein SELMODRAFT_448915-like n=1 Tax=Argentina anserina TaxID=57926 RepID=UPI00217623CD|nr:FAS1 domain-containing protein SELMODRAFT_448915-like [Potentilla anserina]